MIFPDEEARHKFHKSPLLLQVICQMLESELSPFHIQLELVDNEQQENFWVALMVVHNEEYEDSQSMQENFRVAIAKINEKFARYDGKPTAFIESGRHGLATVRVTTSHDFKSLQ